MISFDFAYYRPDTLEEAAQCHKDLTALGKRVVYYGGGTELISMARAEGLRFDAVIDLKAIPACTALAVTGGTLVMGGAVTLTAIAASGLFPLLGDTVSRIADHTIQGKITLGGNLGGTIKYREAALPLMITDCRAKVMTEAGLSERPFAAVFDGRLRLAPGEFLVQILVDEREIALPYNHVKKTRMDKIDYPLITLAANRKGETIRAAVSGAADVPLLLSAEALNDPSLTEEVRVGRTLARLGGLMASDLHGSGAYRGFVLRNILLQMYENFKGA